MNFTGREKLYMVRSLFTEALSPSATAAEPVPLAVSTASAAEAMAFEARLFDLAKQYGINLGRPPDERKAP
jgi:hypothetical protein